MAQPKLKPTRMKIPLLRKLGDIPIDDTVIAWDGGNGTGCIFSVQKNKIVSHTLPNVRVRATGNTLGKGVEGMEEQQLIYADVWMKREKERYAIGDNCWSMTSYTPETFVQSSMRYGSEIQIFHLLVNLCAINAPENVPLTILTSAPPQHVKQVEREIKDALMAGEKGDGGGKWTIQMSYDRKPRTFIIGKVGVMSEGMGGYSAYSALLDGTSTKDYTELPDGGDALGGIVDVHDSGAGTYDTIRVIGGAVAVDNFEQGTDMDFSIINMVIQPIIDHIHKLFRDQQRDIPRLSHAQVDKWIRDWAKARWEKEAAIHTVNGLRLSLHDVFQHTCEIFGQQVIQEKIEPSLSRGADTIMLVGGGWEYIRVYVELHYRDRVFLSPWSFEPLKGIDVWDLNAYGALCWYAAVSRARMQKAS